MAQWTANDIPDLQGRTAIVTGANSGLGLETTRALAAKGAHVIMACRNPDKARTARDGILTQLPQASLELATLDLSSLASIREFASRFLDTSAKLDLLFNNAGVMAPPRRETSDGFEMQFGTNHLGHFALTGLLLPALLATPKSRVVTTSSLMYLMGTMNFDDLNSQHSYARWQAYGQSKLANLLFMLELQARLTQAEADTMSLAAHPGYAHTELQNTSATAAEAGLEHFFYKLTHSVAISQPAAMGALPQLRAGTDPNAHGGEFYGPGSMGGMRGYPIRAKVARKARDSQAARRLWEASVELTQVDYALLSQSAATATSD